MSKFRQILTELSARNTIMAGYYSLTFFFTDEIVFSDLFNKRICCFSEGFVFLYYPIKHTHLHSMFCYCAVASYDAMPVMLLFYKGANLYLPVCSFTHHILFIKGSALKGKNLLPVEIKFFHFKMDAISGGSQNNFDSYLSRSVSILLIKNSFCTICFPR